MSAPYVHGYHPRESERLHDQAGTLADLLHSDTAYPAGSTVLEVGCGVGAQTVTLARNSPGASIVSVDISGDSLKQAEARVAAADLANVQFAQADIFTLPFASASIDHVFVCFVLEHLTQPVRALAALKTLLRRSGTITVIEGDHGSAYFHPESAAAEEAIRCQVELQRRAGGNAMIGRALYPLLIRAGFHDVHVSPRMVYVDSSRPHLVEGFTRRQGAVPTGSGAQDLTGFVARLHDCGRSLHRLVQGERQMKCPTCGIGKLVAGTRDVPYTYKVKPTVIKAVKGQYCDNPKCREVVMAMSESVRTSREMRARSE